MNSKFTITSKILSYVAEIAELTGGINMAEKINKNPTPVSYTHLFDPSGMGSPQG